MFMSHMGKKKGVGAGPAKGATSATGDAPQPSEPSPEAEPSAKQMMDEQKQRVEQMPEGPEKEAAQVSPS